MHVKRDLRAGVFAAAALLGASGFASTSSAQNVQPFNPTPTLDQILASNPSLYSLLGPQNLGTFTRMFSFGESYADTGNEARIGGYPAILNPSQRNGRNSNAINSQDAIEYHYGVAANQTYNYAVGGARTPGFGDNTNGPLYPNYADELQAFLNNGIRLTPRDLVYLEIGGNDSLAFAILTLLGGGSAAQAVQLGTNSGTNISASVGTLIGTGAQTFAILRAGSIENKPYFNGGSPNLRIFDTAQFDALQSGLVQYARAGARIFILNTTLIDDRVRANPSLFGFVEAFKGCQTVVSCVNASITDQNKYYFWDGIHYTSAGYSLLTNYLTNQVDAPSTITPQGSIVLATANSFSQSTFGRLDAYRNFSSYGLGGAYNAYAADMPTKARPMKPVDPTPWWVYGEASYAGGTREASLFNPGGSFSAVGGNIGIEYQSTPNWKVGGVFNYARPEQSLGLQNAHFKADAFQWTGYGSYTSKNWFVDALIGYGRQNIATDRSGVIDTIYGNTHVDLFNLAGRAGYLFDIGSVRIGPIGSLNYTAGSIAGYTETGDFMLTQIVNRQDVESLIGSAGVQFRFPFAVNSALYSPYINVTAEHDFLGDGRVVTTTQTSTLLLPVMTPTNSTNPTYGKIAGGISGTISSNVTGMINAFSTFARSGGNYYGVSGGIKVAF